MFGTNELRWEIIAATVPSSFISRTASSMPSQVLAKHSAAAYLQRSLRLPKQFVQILKDASVVYVGFRADEILSHTRESKSRRALEL